MWITETKSITENTGKRSQSWQRTVDSSVRITLLQYTVDGIQVVSLHDTVMHSVDITAQGRFNPDTSVPHHCTAQTRRRSQGGASWHSTEWKDTLTWLRRPQQQCKGKGCHEEQWLPPWAQSNHISKLMKTLARLSCALLPKPIYIGDLWLHYFKKIHPLKQLID